MKNALKVLEGYVTFCLVIILLFLPVVLYAKLIVDYEELENRIETVNFEKNKKIEELEKEIRILKTDIHIINYGYESEEENEASKM